jgi:hypothetical protein
MGWIPRFFYPLVMAGAGVEGSVFVLVGVAALAVDGSGAGLYAVLAGAFLLLVARIARWSTPTASVSSSATWRMGARFGGRQ